jgi:hypothetical protein
MFGSRCHRAVVHLAVYGEGPERAFFRLMEAILSSTEDVLDLLNWGGRPIAPDIHPSRVMPSSPACFLEYVDLDTEAEKNAPWTHTQRTYLPLEPATLTNLGLRIRLLLIPAILIWPLRRMDPPVKDATAQVQCTPSFWEGEPATFQVAFADTDDYGYIPEPTFPHDIWTDFNPITGKGMVAVTYLGLYMFNEDTHSIEIPRRACAICLRLRLPAQADGSVSLDDLSPRYIKGEPAVVHTIRPIELKRNDRFAGKELMSGDLRVEKSRLAEEGMKLQSLYL